MQHKSPSFFRSLRLWWWSWGHVGVLSNVDLSCPLKHKKVQRWPSYYHKKLKAVESFSKFLAHLTNPYKPWENNESNAPTSTLSFHFLVKSYWLHTYFQSFSADWCGMYLFMQFSAYIINGGPYMFLETKHMIWSTKEGNGYSSREGVCCRREWYRRWI